MRLIPTMVAVGLVVACCAGNPATRVTTALGVACDTYGTALKELTSLRRAGRLSQGTVDTVNGINKEVDKACLPDSTINPAAGVRLVEGAIGLLRGIKEAL